MNLSELRQRQAVVDGPPKFRVVNWNPGLSRDQRKQRAKKLKRSLQATAIGGKTQCDSPQQQSV